MPVYPSACVHIHAHPCTYTYICIYIYYTYVHVGGCPAEVSAACKASREAAEVFSSVYVQSLNSLGTRNGLLRFLVEFLLLGIGLDKAFLWGTGSILVCRVHIQIT